jgi:hypothetical protein
MADIRVCTLGEADLGDAAAYLAGLRGAEAEPAAPPSDLAAETARIHDRLRWQLVRNPARLADTAFGHCLRDAEGAVVGTHLAIPQRFALGARRLVGLLSADLRAAPQAARHSSGMFLAYLRLRGGDFHYATTANRNAGAFWEQRKAPPAPGSDHEFVLVLRPGPVLEELALRRGVPAAAARAARAAGPLLGAALAAARAFAGRGAASRPSVRAADDFDELAALAERHRPEGALTNERSAAHLRWRYGECPGSERNRLLRIDDAVGNRAWAALQRNLAGSARQVRDVRLLDLVRPEALDADGVLGALVDEARRDGDMLRIQGGALPGELLLRRGFRLRRFDGPTSYVAGVDSDGVPLGPRARFCAGDSDTP